MLEQPETSTSIAAAQDQDQELQQQPPARKRGRPPKRRPDLAEVKETPIDLPVPAAPSVPSVPLVYTNEDLDHIRTVQRRIQTLLRRHIVHLKTDPMLLVSKVPGSVEELALDLLPFHLCGTLQSLTGGLVPTMAEQVCINWSALCKKSAEPVEERAQSMMQRIDAVLQREDQKKPFELFMMEQKLFLEEEKFIYGLLKREFQRKYGVCYEAAAGDAVD